MTMLDIGTGKISDISQDDLEKVVENNETWIDASPGVDSEQAMENVKEKTEQVKEQVKDVTNSQLFKNIRKGDYMSNYTDVADNENVNDVPQQIQDLMNPLAGYNIPGTGSNGDTDTGPGGTGNTGGGFQNIQNKQLIAVAGGAAFLYLISRGN